jgi:hypothetical protein
MKLFTREGSCFSAVSLNAGGIFFSAVFVFLPSGISQEKKTIAVKRKKK